MNSYFSESFKNKNLKTFKKILKVLGIVLLLVAVGVGSLYLIYLRPFINKMSVTNSKEYDKSLTIITGGGGNSGILTSDSLILLIDTKQDEAAEVLYNQVKKLAGSKPVLVVNTHYHPDHVSGNKFYKDATILAGGNYTKEDWIKNTNAGTLPNKWLQDSLNLNMGDETVTILNLGKNIHTPSDVVVYLHKRKMLFAGDIILNKQAPYISETASPNAYLTAFEVLPKQFDIQTIVPGHGEVGGIEVLESFKQYFNDMKLAAADASQKDALVAKYKNWGQIPIFMSPNATISAFQRK